MYLAEVLNSIPKDKVVAELDALLDKSSTSISWSCQRLVSIKGFQGSVEVSKVAEKYLEAHPSVASGITNLKERLDYYNLWQKIDRLCSKLHGSLIFKFLVEAKECCYEQVVCCRTRSAKWMKLDDRIILRDRIRNYITLEGTKYPDKEAWCFSFYQKDFEMLWPNQQNYRIIGQVNNANVCVATKEMVEEAYARILTT